MKDNPGNMSPADYGTVNAILFGHDAGPTETGTARGEDHLASLRPGAAAAPIEHPGLIIQPLRGGGVH